MLKKAGIVVAAAAAGLLALSPLAFATDNGYHEETPPTTTIVNEESTSRSPECTFDAAAEWVAAKLDLEPIKVLEVVTFYPGFRQSAPGKYLFTVYACTSSLS